MSYAQIKEYEKAIGFLLKAIEYNPEEELNWCWLGYSYNENEQQQKAINSLLKAVELNPNNEYNWYELGYSYNRINNIKKQQKVY